MRVRALFARSPIAVQLLALIALIVGCDRGPEPTPYVTRTPTPLDLSTVGTIEGTVRFEGNPPAPRAIAVRSDPICAAAHPDGLMVNDVRAHNGRLADVFVYIAQGLEDRVFAVPERPLLIDQQGCWYVPRVAGVQVGQPIRFRSSDDTLHNIHGEPRRSPRWNFGLARLGMERMLTLYVPEVMIPVRCDVHPWMRLDLGVVAHPYFAVTGDGGTFRFTEVPPGSYTMAAWHPSLDPQKQRIEVESRDTVNVNFSFIDSAS